MFVNVLLLHHLISRKSSFYFFVIKPLLMRKFPKFPKFLEKFNIFFCDLFSFCVRVPWFAKS